MPDSRRPVNSRLPRDAAGSLDLHGGTGGITAMCSCGEFLEVYKEGVTFRVRCPESIDPGRTNPNAPFVAAVADSVGSSSPVVARVLLQGRDILEMAVFERQVDKAAVVQLLHASKESLVVCEKVAKRVASHVDSIINEIRAHGLKRDSRGRTVYPFPQAPELEANATAFLVNAKRAIQSICRLPSLFLSVEPKDTNFDALVKTLSKAAGTSSPVTKFVRSNAAAVRYLIDLRNFQEHPGAKRTIVDNFAVMPDGSVAVPMWYVSGETPRPIRDEMLAAVGFLVQIAEAMLIHLVMGAVSKQIPFVMEEIDDTHVNPKTPIRYRLSIDIKRLKTDAQASN